MDAWNAIQWDTLFGYALHDCSCVVLAASALLMALATAGRMAARKQWRAER